MTRPQTKKEKNAQDRLLKLVKGLQTWMSEEFDSCHIASQIAIMGTFNELSQNTTEHVVKLLLSLDKEVREDEEKLSSEDFAKVKAYAESLHRKKQGKKEN
jgi:lactate dehydrogenase-like 2-hydroxyacid dehydrogenase